MLLYCYKGVFIMSAQENMPVEGGEQQAHGKEIYLSPEGVKEIDTALSAMLEAAKSADAMTPWRRNIHKTVGDFDPLAVDPENGNTGHIVDKNIPIADPEDFKTSKWRTYVDGDKVSAYEWNVSEGPKREKIVTLETPLDIGPGNFEVHLAKARTGIDIVGRRIQDFILSDEGKVLVRTADFTKGGTGYRVTGPETKGEATVEQVTFIRDNLSQAELITNNEGGEPIIASTVAPQLAQKN